MFLGKPLRYPLQVPITGQKITSDYGWRSFRGGAFHSALDLRARSGTPVVAPAAGRVSYVGAGAGSRCGGNLRIDHSSTLQTRYCHLSEVLVAPGQTVRAGQVVARSGGDAGDPGAGNSVDAHLHFEVAARKSGGAWQLVDPKKYLQLGGRTFAFLGLGLAVAGGAGLILWALSRRK